MNNIWELTKFVLQTFAFMVTDIQYILLLAVVFILVYRQYAKVRHYEQRMFKLKRLNPISETVISLIYGIMGGFVATILFVGLGVSINEAGITYLWLAAILLMMIHPRFLCFAYAGGLVSLISLLTGFPDLHIATLMAVVAILHLVESFLIFIDGYHRPTPMYYKHRDGKVVGGFALQKFWPLPTIALVGITMASSTLDSSTIAMPEWWPIFQTTAATVPEQSLVHILFPLIVALGYSDFVRTELPQTKARWSAGLLSLYSLLLLGLSLVANHIPSLNILPVLFAPLGHELVIYLGRKREERGTPVFHSEDGVMVLTVYPDSPAEEMGLGAGDVIKSINGVEVDSLTTLVDQISPWVIDPVLVVENQFNNPKERVIEYKGKIPPLGIVPTPHPQQGFYMRIKEGFLQRKLKQWREKRK